MAGTKTAAAAKGVGLLGMLGNARIQKLAKCGVSKTNDAQTLNLNLQTQVSTNNPPNTE